MFVKTKVTKRNNLDKLQIPPKVHHFVIEPAAEELEAEQKAVDDLVRVISEARQRATSHISINTIFHTAAAFPILLINPLVQDTELSSVIENVSTEEKEAQR